MRVAEKMSIRLQSASFFLRSAKFTPLKSCEKHWVFDVDLSTLLGRFKKWAFRCRGVYFLSRGRILSIRCLNDIFELLLFSVNDRVGGEVSCTKKG